MEKLFNNSKETNTLPDTNIPVAPKDGGFQQEYPFLDIFRGYVSFREGNKKKTHHSLNQETPAYTPKNWTNGTYNKHWNVDHSRYVWPPHLAESAGSPTSYELGDG